MSTISYRKIWQIQVLQQKIFLLRPKFLPRKKWKFKNDCKQIAISIILKSGERSPEFKSFDFRKDHLDSFVVTYFPSQNYYIEVQHVCKLIFVSSYRERSIDRGFSVNKQVLQDNLQEKPLVQQRLIYGSLCSSSNLNIEEFEITKNLRLHRKLSRHRYK